MQVLVLPPSFTLKVPLNAGSKKEWSDFCTSLEGTTESQKQELEKAVYEMGEYRLSDDFKHLAIKADRWVGMSIAQRDTHQAMLQQPIR